MAAGRGQAAVGRAAPAMLTEAAAGGACRAVISSAIGGEVGSPTSAPSRATKKDCGRRQGLLALAIVGRATAGRRCPPGSRALWRAF